MFRAGSCSIFSVQLSRSILFFLSLSLRGAIVVLVYRYRNVCLHPVQAILWPRSEGTKAITSQYSRTTCRRYHIRKWIRFSVCFFVVSKNLLKHMYALNLEMDIKIYIRLILHVFISYSDSVDTAHKHISLLYLWSDIHSKCVPNTLNEISQFSCPLWGESGKKRFSESDNELPRRTCKIILIANVFKCLLISKYGAKLTMAIRFGKLYIETALESWSQWAILVVELQ